MILINDINDTTINSNDGNEDDAPHDKDIYK